MVSESRAELENACYWLSGGGSFDAPASSHPMNRSLALICQGAEAQAGQASGLPSWKAIYLRCSPTGWA